MSKGGKITLGIILAILVVGVVMWWAGFMGGSNGSYPAPVASTGSQSSATQTNVAGSSGSGNQSISQEMASVDTQLSGLSSDSASIDQGLNDQPVPQAQ